MNNRYIKTATIHTTGDGLDIREVLDRLHVSYIAGPDAAGIVFSLAYDRAEEVRLWAELKELITP